MSSPISNSVFEDVFKSQPEYINDNSFITDTNLNLLTDEQIYRMLEYFENSNNKNDNYKSYYNILLIIIIVLILLFCFYHLF